jgi:hypothetical protein
MEFAGQPIENHKSTYQGTEAMQREDLSKAAARSVSRRDFMNRSGILAAGSALAGVRRTPGNGLPVGRPSGPTGTGPEGPSYVTNG